MPRGVVGRNAELLLFAGLDDTAVCDTFVRAHLYLHANCHRRLGQEAARRGRELERPTNGSIKAKGKWGFFYIFGLISGYLNKYVLTICLLQGAYEGNCQELKKF